MTSLLVTTVFLAGYVLIVLEHRYQLHKAFTAAALGALLWLMIAIDEGAAVKEAIRKAESEIFGLVFFLLAAMTLVEILVHYRFFDWIRARLLRLDLDDYKQLWVMAGVTFILSAVVDNLTATLVMLAIARRFFRDHNLLIAASSIVIAANAGGAWSPLGDVTSIMLWLAGKFTATDIVIWGFPASVGLFLVSTWMLARRIQGTTADLAGEEVALTGSEKAVIAAALGSFSLPLFFSQIGLEPYFGLVFGLGVVGMLIAIFRWSAGRRLGIGHTSLEVMGEDIPGKHKTHLTSDIEQALARTDIGSLLFFAGILLAVAALEHLGILERVSQGLLGTEPSVARFVVGNGSLGVLSALVDNIPLTAGAISMLKTTDPAIWSLLALATGTGGSMLVIGSAAGVVAMGRIKDLTFFRYIKLATLPAAAGYVAAIAIWYLQYSIVR